MFFCFVCLFVLFLFVCFVCLFVSFFLVLQVPSGYPTNIMINDTTVERQLSFYWDQPTCGQRNGQVIGYDYAFGLDIANGNAMYGWTDEQNRVATFTELEHYTVYQFQVRANTSVGAGPFSEIMEVTSPESSKCKNYHNSIHTLDVFRLCNSENILIR